MTGNALFGAIVFTPPPGMLKVMTSGVGPLII
jgi:hypothetical protein